MAGTGPAGEAQPRPPRRRWITVAAVNLVLAAALVPFAAHAWLQPVTFNQFVLQRLDVSYRVASARTVADGVRSAYGSGLHLLLHPPGGAPPRWTDSVSVFRWIYRRIPPYAVVYPTEGIYYFQTRLGSRRVSGNVRVADLDRGRVSFAYFDLATRETHTAFIGARQGLKVEKRSDYSYLVTFEGRRVHFRLEPPPVPGTAPPALVAAEEEVGRVRDESGLRFVLVFNRETDSFYYLLDEARLPERFERVDDTPYLLGRRTAYVFFEDTAYRRKVLVGIQRENVIRNTWLDGPPDQVPFRASIRRRLLEAYPGALLGPPLDETGVLVAGTDDWARFVIAPVHLYRTPRELARQLQAARVDGVSRSVLWTSLTKEPWNTPALMAQVDTRLKGSDLVPHHPRWLRMLEDGTISHFVIRPDP